VLFIQPGSGIINSGMSQQGELQPEKIV